MHLVWEGNHFPGCRQSAGAQLIMAMALICAVLTPAGTAGVADLGTGPSCVSPWQRQDEFGKGFPRPATPNPLIHQRILPRRKELGAGGAQLSQTLLVSPVPVETTGVPGCLPGWHRASPVTHSKGTPETLQHLEDGFCLGLCWALSWVGFGWVFGGFWVSFG